MNVTLGQYPGISLLFIFGWGVTNTVGLLHSRHC